MKKHTLVLLAIAIIVGFLVFWVLGTNKASAPKESGSGITQPAASSNPEPDTSKLADCPEPDDAVVTYENGTFTPGCITVASGTEITWINKDVTELQVATDPHPSHTGNKEISNGEFVLSIATGARETSTITTTGEHKYHDHKNSDATGRIIVR